MALIKNRPLGVLDRLYNLVGKQTPTQVEVDTPVQLVHDLSREAELSGLGRQLGYASQVMIANTHGAANTQYGVIDVYDQVLSGFDPNIGADHASLISVWLIWWSVYYTANFTRAAVALSIPANSLPPATAETIYPLGYGSTGATYGTAASGNDNIMLGDNRLWCRYPFFIPQGADMTLRSESSGAATIGLRGLFWIGVRGATCPGCR